MKLEEIERVEPLGHELVDQETGEVANRYSELCQAAAAVRMQ
jgi:hypothetical protein